MQLEGENHPLGYAKDIWAVSDRRAYACMVRYDGNDDKLTALIQSALSYTFGADECDEEWCVMNTEYMPHPIYLGIIKIGEEWAKEWGPNCRQRLNDTYNGVTLERKDSGPIGYDGSIITYQAVAWTERYENWQLKEIHLKYTFTVSVPAYRPYVQPSIVGYYAEFN
ncbi:MAG: hypothetical protein QXI91_02250 [Candidatus Bathyarchaeia archaeon]